MTFDRRKYDVFKIGKGGISRVVAPTSYLGAHSRHHPGNASNLIVCLTNARFIAVKIKQIAIRGLINFLT
jgi:hypothetical protein